MNALLYMLCGFVLLGVLSRRLGRLTYLALGCLVVGYVIYAFNR